LPLDTDASCYASRRMRHKDTLSQCQGCEYHRLVPPGAGAEQAGRQQRWRPGAKATAREEQAATRQEQAVHRRPRTAAPAAALRLGGGAVVCGAARHANAGACNSFQLLCNVPTQSSTRRRAHLPANKLQMRLPKRRTLLGSVHARQQTSILCLQGQYQPQALTAELQPQQWGVAHGSGGGSSGLLPLPPLQQPMAQAVHSQPALQQAPPGPPPSRRRRSALPRCFEGEA